MTGQQRFLIGLGTGLGALALAARAMRNRHAISFDGRVQRAVGSEPAVSPDQVGTVARRLHPGFRSPAMLYERESVIVYGPVRAKENPT